MKVLLVEDNERVSAFVRKGLRESGHTVDHADNGRDGPVFWASTESYDVMVLDRLLPGWDRWSCHHRSLAENRQQNPPS